MSRRLISRSPDLQKLEDEGYDLAIVGAYLVVSDVPYVTPQRTVARGALVTELLLADDATVPPTDHTVHFTGLNPCDKDGQVLSDLIASTGETKLAEGLVVHHQFSRKPQPARRYRDFHHKITTYVAILETHAKQIDSSASAQTYPVLIDEDDSDSVFRYLDNASTRAGIVVATEKLKVPKVAIIGLGGTGSYILDLIAKTPAKEIHLFDGDHMLQHNAFRAPGAMSKAELEAKPFKVDYYASKYDVMRYGVIPHGHHVTSDCVHELDGMDFVFLAFDGGPSKQAVLEFLTGHNIDFIDVGMGLLERDGGIVGQLRISTVTEANRGKALDRKHIPNSAADADNDYDRNIQVADLNDLNAALAVIRYKKAFGFYQTADDEHFTIYKLITNELINEDRR